LLTALAGNPVRRLVTVDVGIIVVSAEPTFVQWLRLRLNQRAAGQEISEDPAR
jgi:hypothetical protein